MSTVAVTVGLLAASICAFPDVCAKLWLGA